MGRDHDMPECIVTAALADRLYNGKVVRIENKPCLVRTAGPFSRLSVKARFVECFKNEVVAVILESVGDLRPYLRDFVGYVILRTGFEHDPFVMVRIENRIHAIVDNVVDQIGRAHV